MAKPILLLRMPKAEYGQPENKRNELAALRENMPDYHVLTVFEVDRENIWVEVFNGDDLVPIQIEELKEKLNLKD